MIMRQIILVALCASPLLFSTSCKKTGCMDPNATNYDPEAKKEGDCNYENEPQGSITEDIDSDMTISANEVVTVCGNIDVNAGLTIEEGAMLIMCADAGFNITETGYINAVGTAQNPIIFKGETESKGFWDGMGIYSNNPNNVLNYVTVRDGGSYWGLENSTLFIGSQGKVSIKNSTITNSQENGMYISDDASLNEFENNTFSNCVTGLHLSPFNVKWLDANSDYLTGNDNSYVHVRDGEISSNATWQDIGTPLLTHGLTISGGLTLSAGIEVQVEATENISVSSTGYLKAIATSSNPIQIKGRYNTVGFWGGLKINSNNPNNEFNYVTLQDGGSYWGNEYSNIDLNSSASLKLNNCTIENANNVGVYVGSSCTITCGGQTQTTIAGVESFNTFSSNGTGPDANCSGSCNVFFE